MELPVYNLEKQQVGTVAWDEEFFAKPNLSRIYQVVVQQQTNQRQGSARVKNRHEVTGSTRKIYRQKGTGRARHGDIKAPLFVGGGRAFGPKPRDWSSSLPGKIRGGAVRDLLSLRREENKLWIVDQIHMNKTKQAAQFFKKLGIDSGLLILDKKNPSVERSIRNLPRFSVAQAPSVSVLEMARYEHLLVERGALEEMKKRGS